MLRQAIDDYLLWMISRGYASATWSYYERLLRHFLRFVGDRSIPFEAVFTHDTFAAFQKENKLTYRVSAITGLSRRLFEQGKIPRPIEKPYEKLPEVYEEYLLYCAKSRQVHPTEIFRSRTVLTSLNHCLERSQVDLGAIRIEQVDAFLADYGSRFTPVTKQKHRSSLRGFLRYLYQERGILKKNLAPLVIGAVLFAQTKPPRFLRPQEVQCLFANLDLSSSHGLRSYAMLYLAFALGLRPKEIALLTLDDVSFRGLEIALRNRKGNNPVRLPVPEDAVKAIAAYVVGARPETKERALFLNFRAPYRPVSAATVGHDIGLIMRKNNLPSSAYWLRHTYAQNLLESGTSIFEIKEMLGHDNIQATERYLHIHTKLMREVLFNETL